VPIPAVRFSWFAKSSFCIPIAIWIARASWVALQKQQKLASICTKF
jgi:hypothetical protein